MWADGGPIDPSLTVDQAIYAWLEINCSRCKTPLSVDLAILTHATTICIHDLASRLRCQKCRPADGLPQNCTNSPLANDIIHGRRMRELMRRRDPNLPQECWRICYTDVHVDTVMARTGGPSNHYKCDCNCGFYPGIEPAEHRSGSAETF